MITWQLHHPGTQLKHRQIHGDKNNANDQAKEHNAIAVLRGVRSMTDFDYELQMASMNQSMAEDFETVFLTPANEYSYISSTLVREIASMKGDVAKFVHPAVVTALSKKF